MKQQAPGTIPIFKLGLEVLETGRVRERSSRSERIRPARFRIENAHSSISSAHVEPSWGPKLGPIMPWTTTLQPRSLPCVQRQSTKGCHNRWFDGVSGGNAFAQNVIPRKRTTSRHVVDVQSSRRKTEMKSAYLPRCRKPALHDAAEEMLPE